MNAFLISYFNDEHSMTCVSAYVCVHVYTHTCMYIYIHTLTYSHTHAHILVYYLESTLCLGSFSVWVPHICLTFSGSHPLYGLAELITVQCILNFPYIEYCKF